MTSCQLPKLRIERVGLGTNHAVRINMASRLRSRLKLLAPYVDEKVFRNLQKRLDSIPHPEGTWQKPQSVKGRFFYDLTYLHVHSR